MAENRSESYVGVKRKTLLRIATVVLGIPVLAFAILFFHAFYQEFDGIYWARIWKAKNDIEMIGVAVEQYRQRDGHYPSELDDLLGGGVDDRALLKRIPLSPWQTRYELTLCPPKSDRPYKVWTTPDHETESRTHLRDLSNETDWKAVLH